LVLLSIANHADPFGLASWPSVKTIARESRISQRQAQRSIGRLRKIGELEVLYGLSRDGTNYFVLAKMVRPRCWYCGLDLFMQTRETEHQTPRSRGGKDSLENLVYSCVPCNRKKRDQTLAEYRISTGRRMFYGEGEGRQFVTRPGDIDRRRGVTSATPGVYEMSPEPSLEPSVKQPKDRAHDPRAAVHNQKAKAARLDREAGAAREANVGLGPEAPRRNVPDCAICGRPKPFHSMLPVNRKRFTNGLDDGHAYAAELPAPIAIEKRKRGRPKLHTIGQISMWG
jgi:5-methylcytosine-specific restriction endonuclease McrA